jgi:transposase
VTAALTKGTTVLTIVTDRPARRGRAVPTAWVVGVDTHTDTHAAALIDAIGAVVAQIEVPATPAGYAQLQGWADAQIPAGQRMFWAVEGTRSHGHGLTRHLQTAGYRVVEAVKPEARRRRGGKSDPLDATHAARAALATDRHAEPRADGLREALRMLLVTHRHDTDMRTATINVFKSLLLGAGELREMLRGLSTTGQVRTVSDLPDDPTADLETQVRMQALRRAAATIRDLGRAITAAEKQLRTLIEQACPGLLDLPGVGPISAATLLTVWSHHGRVHSEAAFAAIGGISPLEASSGRVIRHRLNRGGDRALNAALHTIVTTRRRMNHAPTSAYVTRRTTEGLSSKEILRCLKRYAVRNLYRFLEANALTA